MELYSLNILGLSETKVQSNGKKVIDKAGYVNAGVAEGRVRGGVQNCQSIAWTEWLRSWRCMSERCVTIRLRIKGLWIMFIQMYIYSS